METLNKLAEAVNIALTLWLSVALAIFVWFTDNGDPLAY